MFYKIKKKKKKKKKKMKMMTLVRHRPVKRQVSSS